MDINTLANSIEALGNHNFNCPEGASGYTITLYLNAEERRVEVFEDVDGNSWPGDVHNRRWASLGRVPCGARSSSVVETLTDHIDQLAAILDMYEGTEWDGSNWVGCWVDGHDDALDKLINSYEWGFAIYSDPAEWYEGAEREILNMAANGSTPEQIVDSMETDTGEDAVERDEAIAWVSNYIAQTTEPSQETTMICRIDYADGRTTEHDSYQDACDSVRAEYPDAEIGHSGDLEDGGDRTLCWANEADADNDDGMNSVASIRRAEYP